MPFAVGITGGIGSGKTTVARVFEALGYRIYYADLRAKLLMQEDPALRQGITELFGPEAYSAEAELNRTVIAEKAFHTPELLAKLNALVHPRTGADYLQWLADTPADYKLPFVLKEAAILYESGAWRGVGAVLSVYAPKQLRLARVLARDPLSREQTLQRMARQWPEAEKLRRADFVIYNDGSHPLLLQIREAIGAMRSMAAGA